MQVAAWHAIDVITGERLRDARALAKMTQVELAQALGHSVEAIQKWEKPADKGGRGVPRGKEPLVKSLLGAYLDEAQGTSIDDLSDMALFAELQRILGVIARRMDTYRSRDQSGDRPTPNSASQPPSGVIRGWVGDRPRRDTTDDEPGDDSAGEVDDD